MCRTRMLIRILLPILGGSEVFYYILTSCTASASKIVNYELFVSITLYCSSINVGDTVKTNLIVCSITTRRSIGWTTRPIVVICGAIVVLVVVGAICVRVVITISGRRVCAAWGSPGISLRIGTSWSWRHRLLLLNVSGGSWTLLKC